MRPALVRMLAIAILTLLGSRTAAAPAEIRVKYRTATTVYLDAGRALGLTEGQRLVVRTGGQVVAALEVVYLAEHSASCRVVSETTPVAAGQRVQPLGGATLSPPSPTAAPTPAPAPPTAGAPAPAAARERVAPWGRASGGISAGWMRSWDQAVTSRSSRRDLEEYTARADVSVWDLGGYPAGFRLRGSTRHDARYATRGVILPAAARIDRLHEAAFWYDPPKGRLAAQAGRISGAIPHAVGLLDGALVELRATPSVRAGGFYGRAADRAAFEANPGNRYGAFVRLAPPGGWNEVIASFVRDGRGDVAAIESRCRSGRFSMQERAEVETSTLRNSNVYVNTTYKATSAASFSVAYDRQATLRLLEDPLTFEEALRRTLRQGLRASLDVTPQDGIGFFAAGGVGLEAGAPGSWSASAGVRHPHVAGLSLGADGSFFQNQLTRGILATARAGVDVREVHHLELSYGRSSSTLRDAATATRTNEWLRGSLYSPLGRGVFLRLDAEYGRGRDVAGPRGTVETGYRF
jgi:hypothetical protein